MSMKAREMRKVERMPHVSARPPKKSIEMVMPEVRTPHHPARLPVTEMAVLVEIHGQVDEHPEVDEALQEVVEVHRPQGPGGVGQVDEGLDDLPEGGTGRGLFL